MGPKQNSRMLTHIQNQENAIPGTLQPTAYRVRHGAPGQRLVRIRQPSPETHAGIRPNKSGPTAHCNAHSTASRMGGFGEVSIALERSGRGARLDRKLASGLMRNILKVDLSAPMPMMNYDAVAARDCERAETLTPGRVPQRCVSKRRRDSVTRCYESGGMTPNEY